MEDLERAVARVVYGYAERLDAGDVTGAAEILAPARWKRTPDDIGITGTDAIAEFLDSSVSRYDDGTPRTKHLVTNLVIEHDEKVPHQARARSYFVALQQLDDFPLQPIMAGRFHDWFEHVDGEWRLMERVIFADLFGDVSHHIRNDSPATTGSTS